MNIIAIVQARMSSTRLPGKVMLPLQGEPMLVRQMQRIMRSKKLTNVIVATSDDLSDNIIELLCLKNNYNCFRGKLFDVLDRYYQAAKQFKASHIVRLTADCPLTSSYIIDEIINLHIDSRADYTSNCLKRTLPKGLDAEVISFNALEKIWLNAKTKDEREHVTLYIHHYLAQFKVASYEAKVNNCAKRWTVDYQLDFDFVNEIYNNLYDTKPNFDIEDILNLLKIKPQLEAINADCI